MIGFRMEDKTFLVEITVVQEGGTISALAEVFDAKGEFLTSVEYSGTINASNIAHTAFQMALGELSELGCEVVDIKTNFVPLFLDLFKFREFKPFTRHSFQVAKENGIRVTGVVLVQPYV